MSVAEYDLYAPTTSQYKPYIVGPLSLVSAVHGSIITTAEAKLHCKIETGSTEEDTPIAALVQAATTFCEQEIMGHRQLFTATYDLPVSDWFEWLKLPRPPLQSVTSVKYYDTNGTEQTLATTYYAVRTPLRQQGVVYRAPDQTWPTLQSDREYPITIRFVAGYLAPVTAATTDLITSTGRAFTDNQVVRFWNVGGALPAGLSTGTDYYVRDASSQTFKVATIPASTAVDITDTGTGLHYCGMIPYTIRQAILMTVAHWYRNRESVADKTLSDVPHGVMALLESEGWGSYA